MKKIKIHNKGIFEIYLIEKNLTKVFQRSFVQSMLR